MNYGLKCQLLAEGYKHEQLDTPETKSNKELKKLGLRNNNTNRKKSSVVSWNCSKKMIEFLKSNGALTTPTGNGNEYLLEYNLKTKKFQLTRKLNIDGKEKWFNPVIISGEIEQTAVFKKLREFASQFKGQKKHIEEGYFNY